MIAHRGGGTLAPENTLAGMQEARQRGFRAVEFDVMLAADGVPVLMHDSRFGRTVSGRGSVAATTSAELAKRDAGSWLAPQFRGEPVPMLDDIIRWLHAAGIWMNIEIKPAPGHDVTTGRATALGTRTVWSALTGPAEASAPPPLFSSFSATALRAAQETAPEFARAMLYKRIPPDWQRQLEELDCIALHCSHAHLTAESAAAIKAAGYGLMCYTVNSPRRARELFSWGVDAVCTDRLDLLPADLH